MGGAGGCGRRAGTWEILPLRGPGAVRVTVKSGGREGEGARYGRQRGSKAAPLRSTSLANRPPPPRRATAPAQRRLVSQGHLPTPGSSPLALALGPEPPARRPGGAPPSPAQGTHEGTPRRPLPLSRRMDGVEPNTPTAMSITIVITSPARGRGPGRGRPGSFRPPVSSPGPSARR